MKPTALLNYWSNRPLNKTQFLQMIYRDYLEVIYTHPNQIDFDNSKELLLLKDFLYQADGQLPAVVEFSQQDIDEEELRPMEIEYLIYVTDDRNHQHQQINEYNTSWNPLSSSDISPTASRYITADIDIEERNKRMRDGWECVGISTYGEKGIEIEFEKVMVGDYSLREYSSLPSYNPNQKINSHKTQEYIQLEYFGSSINTFNYPGGLP
jgi:hypothetical protein